MTALIAFANRGGEQGLRKLELRCLAAGIIVARTSDDLIRYHGKYILIDRRVLYVLSFNFTHLDIDHSRGFGIVTTRANWVREAARLFRADCTPDEVRAEDRDVRRQPGELPEGARHVPETREEAVADLRPQDLRQGDARHAAGAGESGRRDQDHRLGGRARPVRRAKAGRAATAHAHDHPRSAPGVHRQPEPARTEELDSRRELGLIVQDAKAVKKLVETFESDWVHSGHEGEGPEKRPDGTRRAAAGARTRKPRRRSRSSRRNWIRSSVSVKKAVRQAVAKAGEDVLHDKGVKDTMKKVVKKAVKEAVKEAVEESKKA